jgi:hypothetical protein
VLLLAFSLTTKFWTHRQNGIIQSKAKILKNFLSRPLC